MGNESMMYQCALSRGTHKQVAWVPSRGARKGLEIELKEDGLFWHVDEVFEPPVSEQYLKEKQRFDRKSFASIEE